MPKFNGVAVLSDDAAPTAHRVNSEWRASRGRPVGTLALACIVGTLATQRVADSAAITPRVQVSPRVGEADSASVTTEVPKTFGETSGPMTAAGPDLLTPVDRQLDVLARAVWASQWLAPDWDNEGATPPSAQTAADAMAIINNLPANAQLPEFALASDGEVILRWRQAKRTVDISLLGDGMAYVLAGARPPIKDDPTLVSFATEVSSSALPRDLVRIIPVMQS